MVKWNIHYYHPQFALTLFVWIFHFNNNKILYFLYVYYDIC